MNKALIGCRVYRDDDDNKEIIGKIVDFYVTDRSNFLILRTDGEFDIISPSSIVIVKEDFNKVYDRLQPVAQKQDTPIGDRFEIMDL